MALNIVSTVYFSNFHPIIISPTGTHQHHTIAIFKSLSACGVDAVELKRSIAIILLKSRARAYRAIYDAAKTPHIDKDHSLSPPSRSSVRAACARTQSHPGPASTAPVDRQMDTVRVKGPSCVVSCMLCICN